MFVLEFLTKKEIEKIFDKDSRLVIKYLLQKVLFSQPELQPGEKDGNIQMTKEFFFKGQHQETRVWWQQWKTFLTLRLWSHLSVI